VVREALLFLVHRIPYPPNKGDKVRSFRILCHLARRYRVFLASFVDRPEDWAHVPTLDRWCEAVCMRPIHPARSRALSLRGLLAGEALSLPYYRDARMARWTADVVRQQEIRRAVVFSGPMAQYLQDLPVEHSVVDFCDVDSEKWLQYAPTKPWPLSWLYRREGRRLAGFEQAVAARVQASLFVTAAEAALFRKAMPELAARIAVMENGVDVDYFSPRLAYGTPFPAGGRVVVFTGAMDYWPNVDAVCWFARDILPHVRQTLPGLQFWVVGMNPVPEVLALAREGHAVVTGGVPDIRPYLRHADAVVAPLRIARGIQNKILEAMAMARPVVAHSACMQGLSVQAGEEILVATDVGEFATALAIALGPRGEAIGAAARARVVASQNWDRQLEVLDHALAGEPA
jgi:sugar transferase (PEP-CTERM/EpsH1 system associated)